MLACFGVVQEIADVIDTHIAPNSWLVRIPLSCGWTNINTDVSNMNIHA